MPMLNTETNQSGSKPVQVQQQFIFGPSCTKWDHTYNQCNFCSEILYLPTTLAVPYAHAQYFQAQNT